MQNPFIQNAGNMMKKIGSFNWFHTYVPGLLSPLVEWNLQLYNAVVINSDVDSVTSCIYISYTRKYQYVQAGIIFQLVTREFARKTRVILGSCSQLYELYICTRCIFQHANCVVLIDAIIKRRHKTTHFLGCYNNITVTL